MNSLRLIDFAPVIAVASGVGLGFVKLLVYLHRRQGAHPGMRRGR